MNVNDMKQAIRGIDVVNVKRVYAGRPGCGCGCLGKYWDDARNIRRVVNEMKRHVDDDGARLDFAEDLAAVEGTRYLWAYFS